MLNDKVEYNSSLFRYFIYRSFRREKWLEYISVYKTTRVHRISNRIYPFPVTNNRDNINARNFSLFRLIHEKPIRFPDPPPCVFFKHSVHRFANFAPGGFPSNEIPSRISIPPRISYRSSTLKTPRALSGITLRIRLSLFPLYTYPLHFPPFIPLGSWLCGPIIERMVRKHHGETLIDPFVEIKSDLQGKIL